MPTTNQDARVLPIRTALPTVSVIGLGGTIASIEQDPDARARGALPELTAEDLLTAVPEAVGVAQVTGRSLRLVSSASLTLGDVLELFSAIGELIADGADGVVVTQGTDTLEETSFVLDLLHKRPEPIVVTGAMRVASSSSADGPANLLAAIRVAAAPQARQLGAVVVMADEIHAARWVMKRHASRVTAFDSPMAGPIGWVSEGQVRIAMRPVACPKLDVPHRDALCPIATVALGLGDDGRLLADLPGKGYGGVVIEGMGGGHVPEGTMELLTRVAAEIPVVVASRTGCGELLRSTYAFPGSETDILSRGLISAGALSAPKARLLLMLLLATGVSRTDLGGLFDNYSIPR
jgi:L-asparaginase